MNVNILPPDVIAKIAAGEVVSRPASVIKELVENALDAGATAVEVHLKDAGKELIHVKDNGCGIPKADLETIFQRHATSKINTIDDLERLHSMGFRGEALYSIAAVSDITLKSQNGSFANAQDNECWKLHLRGGQRLSLEPAAPTGQGTEIKVSELFFNTPARRKFLKSSTAELHQILNTFLPYTLIDPNKKFTLTHAGRGLLDLRTAPSRLERASAALNVDARDLIESDQEFPQDNIRVRMILGNINIQRPRRDLQFIFINNRPVDSKNLSFNLNDMYKLILPPGVYGAFILDMTLNPANVDVNIHPAKREVRLNNEAKITSLIRRMAEYQLMHKGQAKNISADLPALDHSLPTRDLIFAPGQIQSMFNPTAYANREFFDTSAPVTGDSLRDKFSQARFVGQFMNKYLLFEAQAALMIVDQHAAQERILFEKFKNQIEQGRLEIQPLLTPVVLKLTPQEKIVWEETRAKLQDVGIETTQFDEEAIAVQTQPLLLKNIERAVRALLSGDDAARCDRLTIARRACKASVVAGDKLSCEQADHQRRQLLECQDPFTCPHGRPTVIELTDSFLEKQFLRA